MGSPWLAVLFLAGAVVGAAWWFRGRRVETFLSTGDSVTAHLVMNLGMAVMATPLYSGGVRGALIAVVAVLAAYFALRLVTRGGGTDRARRSADAYHLVAAAAMVFAIVLMPAGAAGHGAAGQGMAGHGMAHGSGGHDVAGHGVAGQGAMAGHEVAGQSVAGYAGDAGGAAGVVAVALAVLFALDALGTAALVAFAPGRVASVTTAPAGSGPVSLTDADERSLRIAAVPHVIMDAGMVWMLVLAV